MSTMAFGIYSPEGGNATITNKLIIEISNSHMACLATASDNMITDFELYTFNKKEALDFEKLFVGVVAKSEVFSKTYNDTKLYINNEYALLVPAAKFDKEILDDFLNVAFGEDQDSIPHYDSINTGLNLITAYRLSGECLKVADHHFKPQKIKHTFTPVIARLITDPSNVTLIKVQFYPLYFIAVVVKEGALQFIQYFLYQSSDDVLYYLLSISQRFNLKTPDLTIYVSGMIDLKSALFSQLEKFFGNIVVDEADKSKLLINVDEYPSHYFTPFFNLAL